MRDDCSAPAVPLSAWLRDRPHLRLIVAETDCMEPTIARGDAVLLDAHDTTAAVEFGIYVLGFGDVPTLARISRRPGGFAITCDNPHYQPRFIAAAEIDTFNILGRVVMHGRRL